MYTLLKKYNKLIRKFYDDKNNLCGSYILLNSILTSSAISGANEGNISLYPIIKYN